VRVRVRVRVRLRVRVRYALRRMGKSKSMLLALQSQPCGACARCRWSDEEGVSRVGGVEAKGDSPTVGCGGRCVGRR
jgi:hypothetical protein